MWAQSKLLREVSSTNPGLQSILNSYVQPADRMRPSRRFCAAQFRCSL